MDPDVDPALSSTPLHMLRTPVSGKNLTIGMTSGPKSAGCQLCKQRRIKCDERWPTCGNCARARQTCPGPSELLKFVFHRRPRGPNRLPARSRTRAHQPQVLMDWMELAAYRNGSAVEGVYRLAAPRASLASAADMVAGQLVRFLSWGFDAGLCLQMGYLIYLPNRLSQSECLRNTTALFCHAWNEKNRGRASDGLFSTSLYGESIRSVQDAVNGDQACTADTLAAMQILERIATCFGTDGIVGNPSSHYAAMQWVLAKKPAPRPDDKFDLMLTSEANNILSSVSNKGDGSFSDSPWKNYAEEAHYDSMSSEEIKGSITLSSCLSQLIEWIHPIKLIRANPHENKVLKNRLLRRIQEYDKNIEKIINDTMEAAFLAGDLRAFPDQECIAGIRYEFSSATFATGLAGVLFFRVNLLQIIHDLKSFYETDVSGDYQKYRALCMELWKFIPYATSLDSLSLRLCGCILPTIEAMNEDEKKYLLDNLERVDTSKKVVGGREHRERLGVAVAMFRTGRA